MGLLIDTQAIVLLGLGDPRFSLAARQAVIDGVEPLFVSAVTAWEFADLNARGRFAADLRLGDMLAKLSAEVLDFPAQCWEAAAALPDIHRDPVDRMLIAHAIHADLTLLTADAQIRRYPVRSLW